MKKYLFIPVFLAGFMMILGSVFGPSVEADQKAKDQTLCPVMGAPIDKSVFVDYEGTRVFFCCPGCKSEFLKEPEKYLNKMKSDGIVLEAAPTSG